jgi:hypothetical protein
MNIDKLNTQAVNNSLESGNINVRVTAGHDPIADKQAVTLRYLENFANQYLLKSNPQMAGALKLTYSVTDDNQIVNKQFVLDASAQGSNNTRAYFNNSIKNYVLKSGDTITGDLVLSGNPANDLDLATYGYLQNKLSIMSNGANASRIKTGTVVEVPYNYTYDNSAYLLCNGASVSKSDYSALYNVIGDSSGLSSLGAGAPWHSQYGFNPSTQNDVTGWVSSNSLVTAERAAAPLATKNYIYILGGYNNSNGPLNTIQRASFDANGDLSSTWSNVGTLPVAMHAMGYVATKGRFYLIGGDNNSGYLSSVYSAPINADGTLGTFRAETSMPAAKADSACFIIKDKLYAVGGKTDSFVNSVYRATVNNDGTLSGWETLPNFPINFSYGRPLHIKDRIYIFGAYDGNGNSYIYYTTYDSDGNINSWTNVTNMPNNMRNPALVCTDNYVFSIAGYDSNNSQYSNAAYRAPINIDGSIGAWTQITNGPVEANYPQTVIVGNRIYIIGGFKDSNFYNSVYSANFASGITDYTQYYTDQSNAPSASSTFNLPDLTSRSNASPKMKYIIKT